jgi:hypothetical protein
MQPQYKNPRYHPAYQTHPPIRPSPMFTIKKARMRMVAMAILETREDVKSDVLSTALNLEQVQSCLQVVTGFFQIKIPTVPGSFFHFHKFNFGKLLSNLRE